MFIVSLQLLFHLVLKLQPVCPKLNNIQILQFNLYTPLFNKLGTLSLELYLILPKHFDNNMMTYKSFSSLKLIKTKANLPNITYPTPFADFTSI